ncbi:hypothetical protein KR038_003442 [Drosophila bunnanda]|nr:hypothetical protein KR038_003442 [Drosophila bunnanda]
MDFGYLLADEDEEEVAYINLNQKITKRIVRMGPDDAVNPKIGSLVTINLIGFVEPNIIVEELMRFQCHLGDFEVVEGLELVLHSMKEGEVASVSMDSNFAYGIFGLQDRAESSNDFLVPPYSPISYNIELLSIKSEVSKDIQDDGILCSYVARKKARSDFWLMRLEFQKAIHLYNRAQEYLLKIKDDEKAKALTKRLALSLDLVKYRGSMVYKATKAEVDGVLRLEPNNPDALFRKAKMLKCVGNTKDALALMLKVTELDAGHRDAAAEVSLLQYHEASRNYQDARQKEPCFNIRNRIVWFMVANIILCILYLARNHVLETFINTC